MENIDWTESDEEKDPKETSINKEAEKEAVKDAVVETSMAEMKKGWFRKETPTSTNIVDDFGEVRADKRAMKYEIIAWEFDKERNLYIIKRQKGYVQYVKSIQDFSSFPRWDLNKLADLELRNPSGDNGADAWMMHLKRQKIEGWTGLKPRQPRKMKIKNVDPSSRKKFTLKPHMPNTLSQVPYPAKMAPCLHNATGMYYHKGDGQLVIDREIEGYMVITDPLAMFAFCEEDSLRLQTMPLRYGEKAWRDIMPYLANLQENLENYKMMKLSGSTGEGSSSQPPIKEGDP